MIKLAQTLPKVFKNFMMVLCLGGVALICGVMSFQFWGHGSILIQQTFIALIPIFLLGFWEDLFKVFRARLIIRFTILGLSSGKTTGYNLSHLVFIIDKVISGDFVWILITVFALPLSLTA